MNTYIFDSSAKKNILIAFGIGVLLLLIGIFTYNSGAPTGHGDDKHAVHAAAKDATHAAATEGAEHGHGHEAPTLRTSLIANSYNVFYYFFYIALGAIFILAAANVAWGGWQIQVQKITLAMTVPIVVFLGLLFVMFFAFNHDIFHWTHESLYVKGSDTFDEVLNIKKDFLNMKTFWSFTIVIAISCVWIVIKFWNTLTKMDTNPSRKLFSSSRVVSAVSIVVISFLINTFATWLWSMSIQPHWYSTMFTWNTMSGACVAALSIMLLFIHYLKAKGYLPNVNENHEHDVAKLMFAISIFWCYTWFAQYMLIWYANIPEETEYFRLRRNLDNYGILFHGSWVMNFIIPFFVLMTRNAKRKKAITTFCAIVIILGQFGAFFLMNCPPLLPKGGFGLISIGLLLIFGSIFTYITLMMLAKVKDLSSTTHPYYKESYNLHI